MNPYSNYIKLITFVISLGTIASSASELKIQADALHRDKQEPSEGISLGVIEENDRTFAAAGKMRKDGNPVDENTLYEIGSITKVFTGILLADTLLQGKAELDDSIGEHLPKGVLADDSPLHGVTLLQLATHTSGLPRIPSDLYDDNDREDPYAHYSRERLFAYLSKFEEEDFEKPGTYSYSNLGVGLLGELLADINHTDYTSLLKKRILDPLGMDSTWVQRDLKSEPDNLKDRFATGHNGGAPKSHWHLASFSGAGAMVSSVNDLLSFAEAHWSEHTPEYLKKAFALASEKHTEKTGLGWHFYENSLVHSGGTGGFKTWIRINPADKFAKVNLTNSSGQSMAIVREGDFSRIAGFWTGSLEYGKNNLRLVMHVTDNGNADHYSIDQATYPMFNSKSIFENDELFVSYPQINGSYRATLENGKLVGTWDQGSEIKLDMEYSESMPPALGDVYDRAYKGNLEPLIGFWRGRIGDPEDGLFIYIEVSEIADRYIVRNWSPTQTPLPIGISSFSIEDNTIEFESKRVKASYSGKLDPVSKTIIGTWSQTNDAPLTLTWSETRPETT